MKHIHLEGSWVVKAPRQDIYDIVSDFEKMPKNFPAVAESTTQPENRVVIKERK